MKLFLKNMNTGCFIYNNRITYLSLKKVTETLGSKSVFNGLEISKLAHPFLKELMSKTRETVHLVIRDGHEGVYIDKVESLETIRMASRIGFRAPLYCTAVGKVLLSDLSEEKINRLLDKKNLVPFTENTKTDWDALMEELRQVKEKGFAIDYSEHEKDVRCVAAPVKNYMGKVIAAISIAAPAFRLSKNDFGRRAMQVKESAFEISRIMGYTGL